MGCVMLLLEEQDAPLGEAEQKLVQTVAGFWAGRWRIKHASGTSVGGDVGIAPTRWISDIPYTRGKPQNPGSAAFFVRSIDILRHLD